MSDKKLKDLIDVLNHRKRSLDVLKLLIDDGDKEMAFVIATKLRADLNLLIAELAKATGRPAEEMAAPAPAAGMPAAPRPPTDALQSPPERGYLGDDEGPGKLERWVEDFIRRCWDAVADPKETMRRLYRYRRRIAAVVGVALLFFTASRAYERIFLSRYGLTGEYYLDTELRTLFTKRLDHTVDFRWLRRAPMTGFRAENFSIRWTGFVKIDAPGTYEFYTISDDGVRLWVNDQQLIDNWTIHGGTLDKGELVLSPGYYPIRLEYYQGSGDMVIKLHWKRPGENQKKVIAARYLHPEVPNE